MQNTVEIRGARPSDAECLAALAVQVWLQTYATDGVSPTIAKYVAGDFTAARLGALIADSSRTVIVAEIGEHRVGYAVLGFRREAPRQESDVELETLYVQPNFARRGIGSMLLRSAEDNANERGRRRGLWLKTNAKNSHAIRFYEYHGYARAGLAYFELGDEKHENIVFIGGRP
jgi:ribosomal protein S18 acetylase RimI-like enzyme